MIKAVTKVHVLDTIGVNVKEAGLDQDVIEVCTTADCIQ